MAGQLPWHLLVWLYLEFGWPIHEFVLPNPPTPIRRKTTAQLLPTCSMCGITWSRRPGLGHYWALSRLSPSGLRCAHMWWTLVLRHSHSCRHSLGRATACILTHHFWDTLYIMVTHVHECTISTTSMIWQEWPLHQASSSQGFNLLRTLMQEFDVAEYEHKAIYRRTKMVWIGIEFDSVLMQMCMPPQKMEDTLSLCRSWRTRCRAILSQLQQLLGKLFHISQSCKPARLLVSRMLNTLVAAPPHGFVSLASEFRKDLD